ncbi:MAG TPA: hypothetical protein VGE42_02670, partial [Candidatus Dormibacteraeota bacterium]
VLSGGYDGTVRGWQLDGGAPRHAVHLGSCVETVAFGPPGVAVAGTAMGIVVLHLGGAGAAGAGS